jgi:hypothetical protein
MAGAGAEDLTFLKRHAAPHSIGLVAIAVTRAIRAMRIERSPALGADR